MNAIVGIPDKTNFGSIKGLKEGNIYEFVVQEHDAERAGKHLDLRIGDKNLGLLSWALPSARLPGPGEKVLAVLQPLHAFDYKDFSGVIPSGYGKGSVSRMLAERAIITGVDPDKKRIYFTVASTRYPTRFVLLNPNWKDTNDKNWLLINITKDTPLPYEKVRLPLLSYEKLMKVIEDDNVIAEPKIDGAHGLIFLGDKNIDIFSHRISRTTGYPITHTERIFPTKPILNLPLRFAGSVLRGEIFATGTKPDGTEYVLSPQHLSALLNSTIDKTLDYIRKNNIKFRVGLFDVSQLAGTVIDPNQVDYPTRLKYLTEILQYLPKDVFMLVPRVQGKKSILDLLDKIATGNNPLTKEGIVIYKPFGYPYKYKLRKEDDVYIRRILPGEGKYSNVAGAFEYSVEPDGPILGTVGTGFSDEFRKFLWENADALIGRRARITFQDRFPSGAYRAPAFIALHEDYPTSRLEKSASFLNEYDNEWFKAIDNIKKIASYVHDGVVEDLLSIPVLEYAAKAHTGLEKLIGGPTVLTSILVDSLLGLVAGDLTGRALTATFPKFFRDSSIINRLRIVGALLGGSVPFALHGLYNISDKGWTRGLLSPSPIQEAILKSSSFTRLVDKLSAVVEDCCGCKIVNDLPSSKLFKTASVLNKRFDVNEWSKLVLDSSLSPWEKTILVTVPLTASVYRDSDWVTPLDVARVTANMELGSLFGRLLGGIAVPLTGLSSETIHRLDSTGRLTGLLKSLTNPIKEAVDSRSVVDYEVRKALQV